MGSLLSVVVVWGDAKEGFSYYSPYAGSHTSCTFIYAEVTKSRSQFHHDALERLGRGKGLSNPAFPKFQYAVGQFETWKSSGTYQKTLLYNQGMRLK